MRLHAEVPLVTLLGLVHLRVAGFALVLGRGWRGDLSWRRQSSLAASATRVLQASPRPHRTTPSSDRAVPASGGNSSRSSRPELSPPPDQCRQIRATPDCRTARLPALRQPARTTAAKSRAAACVPIQPEADRARLSGRRVAAAPPTAPTEQPAPSRRETCPVASASSCRRTPLAKSSLAAALHHPEPAQRQILLATNTQIPFISVFP